jgi:hypothetical protein
VELELEAEACKRWLAAEDESTIDEHTSYLASRLWDTLRKFNPLEMAAPTSLLRVRVVS